jgi:hypothetical protein
MYRLVEKFIRDETVMPKAVLLILGVSLFAVGLYAVGPWYVGGPTTAMGAVLETDLIRAIPAAFYMLAGGAAVYGVVKKKARWRYRGAFLSSTAFFFLTLLRLLTFGFTPVIWIFILALCLISAIIYLWESGREVE